MKKELKKAIIDWLIENENTFNRLSHCKQNFRDYIYDKNGDLLKYGIGAEVANFVEKADKLLYGSDENV